MSHSDLDRRMDVIEKVMSRDSNLTRKIIKFNSAVIKLSNKSRNEFIKF